MGSGENASDLSRWNTSAKCRPVRLHPLQDGFPTDQHTILCGGSSTSAALRAKRWPTQTAYATISPRKGNPFRRSRADGIFIQVAYLKRTPNNFAIPHIRRNECEDIRLGQNPTASKADVDKNTISVSGVGTPDPLCLPDFVMAVPPEKDHCKCGAGGQDNAKG